MSAHPKPKRTPHDLEFKQQAVQLLHTSGRPLAQIARELRLPAWQLRDWKQRLQPQLDQQPETLEALRRHRAHLERDLKYDTVLNRHYYHRDRDLGQTFRVGTQGFRLDAITIRSGFGSLPFRSGAAGAEMYLQILRVEGTPGVNHHGTTSNPPGAPKPSKLSQPATVSMESAITSRDTSEHFFPQCASRRRATA